MILSLNILFSILLSSNTINLIRVQCYLTSWLIHIATVNGWCVSVDGPNNVHMKVSLLPEKSDVKTSENFDQTGNIIVVKNYQVS